MGESFQHGNLRALGITIKLFEEEIKNGEKNNPKISDTKTDHGS